MNRISVVILGAVLAATLCFGQGSSPTPAAISHGAFPVKVAKTLDSSKLKEGDTVEVQTAGSFKLADGTLVPKGSKLTGHVTASKARSKGDTDSQLALTFDKLNVANGNTTFLTDYVSSPVPGGVNSFDIEGASPTPEPASFALAGIGIAAVLVARRRKRLS